MTIPCTKEEELGRIKEFINNTKGMRPTITSVVILIFVQIITFAFLWGDITRTVKDNTVQVWDKLTPATLENTRNIDKILEKIQVIKIIGIIGETGATGKQGIQGIQGIQGVAGKDK